MSLIIFFLLPSARICVSVIYINTRRLKIVITFLSSDKYFILYASAWTDSGSLGLTT